VLVLVNQHDHYNGVEAVTKTTVCAREYIGVTLKMPVYVNELL